MDPTGLNNLVLNGTGGSAEGGASAKSRLRPQLGAGGQNEKKCILRYFLFINVYNPTQLAVKTGSRVM